MSVSFEINKTLHGYPEKRFIQLKSISHKVTSSDPDVNLSPGFFKESYSNSNIRIHTSLYLYL